MFNGYESLALCAETHRYDENALTDDERENYEERCGILEYDAEMPRAEAEREALRLVVEGRKWRE